MGTLRFGIGKGKMWPWDQATLDILDSAEKYIIAEKYTANMTSQGAPSNSD